MASLQKPRLSIRGEKLANVLLLACCYQEVSVRQSMAVRSGIEGAPSRPALHAVYEHCGYRAVWNHDRVGLKSRVQLYVLERMTGRCRSGIKSPMSSNENASTRPFPLTKHIGLVADGSVHFLPANSTTSWKVGSANMKKTNPHVKRG
jgi:hypothetical protein